MKSASLNRDTSTYIVYMLVIHFFMVRVCFYLVEASLCIFLLQVNAFVLSLGTNSQEADGWDPVCKFNPCTLLCLSQSHDHNFYWFIWCQEGGTVGNIGIPNVNKQQIL
jgi:hypothetical protein